ncbi:MAG: NAD(P)/FAD-dependent oxidoreductase [Chthoniobacterales bacterium]|nr:NAD(P)/FAD-dependent oxidoreductase [Chthoniobacterales bacterium]
MEKFDVAIVGAGPAGSACAALCAEAGFRTLLLEREKFPREKVCGDCLNPSVWPVLERLGLAQRVRALPHGELRRVDFVPIRGRTVSVDLPEHAEIAVKRSLLDQLLVARAKELGAEFAEQQTVTAITEPNDARNEWQIKAAGEAYAASALVAADGRNSTVARLFGLLPRPQKERVGLQTHVPLPPGFGERVVLQFLPAGYSGQAPVGTGELNLCLVSKARDINELRDWAEREFGVPPDHQWRTITPLRREALAPARRRLFLVGDAARVVEPFTGEGIYYALHSGELAARAIHKLIESGDEEAAVREYTSAHEELYRGRLWVNRLARAAVLSPQFTSSLLHAGVLRTAALRALTAKIVR